MAAPDETSSLRFGNYEVLTRPDGKPDELGRGGFGRTYRARHVFLGTEVALKVIIDRLAADEAAKKRFLKEAREHARLTHPGIARITDFGEAEGTFFYAMELCRDGDLKEYVKKRGALPAEEALDLIRQTAEALHYAHSHGILHRDVKPSNLLLVMENGRPPQVKLIDFGLVRKISQGADETIDASSASQWSPVFASPEQIRELPLDERTDIFSLGMTAWFLLRGGGPVDGNTHEIVAERLNHESYGERLPADLSGAAREVVMKMVEKDTAKRFRKCEELIDGLRRVLSGQAAAPARPAQRITDRFTLQPAGREYAGEVFRGSESHTGRRVRVTRVYREHEAETLQAAQEKVKALAAAQAPGLVPIFEMAEFADGVAIIEEDVAGKSVEETLRREGAVPLAKVAPVLWDAATGLDAVLACGAVPGALEQSVLTGADKSPVDWTAVQIHILVKIIADTDEGPQEADVTAAPAPTSPLKSFASLVYLAAGGRHVRPQALYSSAACIPISGLSSGGNRLLAAALAGESKPENCLALLQSLLAAEAVPAEGVARRARERHQRLTAERAAEAAARTATAGRTITATRTGTGAAAHTGSPPATTSGTGFSDAERTDSLSRLESAVRQAKDAADQTLRVKLPPGRDDSALCQHQVESRKWAREAATALHRAQEMSREGQYDRTAAKTLTDTASSAAAEAMRLLTLARNMATEAAKSEEATRYEAPLPDTMPVATPPPPIRSHAPPPAAHQTPPVQHTPPPPVATPPAQKAVPGQTPAATPPPPQKVETPPPLPPARQESAPQRQQAPPPPPPPKVQQAAPHAAGQPTPVPAPPVPLIIPPRGTAKKKSPVAAIVTVLVLAAAGGGWYYYYDLQKKKQQQHIVDNKNGETKTPEGNGTPGDPDNKNGNVKNPVKDPVKDPVKVPVKDPDPPPLPPPDKREVIITFTGDLPEKPGDVSFKGLTTPKPTASGGAVVFMLTLPPDAPDPEPIVDGNRFASQLVTRDKDRITYKLTRKLPPNTVRLSGLTARDWTAITIGGRKGEVEGDELVIPNSSDEKGNFTLDTAAWRFASPPDPDGFGVVRAQLKLAMQKITFVPGKGVEETPWSDVVFTAVKPGVLPPLEDISDEIGAASVGEDDVKFSIEELPESVTLPAGDWTVEWKPRNPAAAAKNGGKISVKADETFSLDIPQ